MNKRLLFMPAGAVAIGAAVVYLSNKTWTAKKAKAKAASSLGAKPASQLKAGSYSFASGYKESAKTVELSFSYDPEKYAYSVISEDFISETGVAHAGILRGEDLGIQLEYASHFGGEDFTAYSAHISQRNKGFEPVSCNGVAGIKFFDGKNLCFAFPASGTDYVLVTAAALGDNCNLDAAALWSHADVRTVLDTLSLKAV